MTFSICQILDQAFQLWISDDLRVFKNVIMAQLSPHYDHTPQEFITHQPAVMELGWKLCKGLRIFLGEGANKKIKKTKC